MTKQEDIREGIAKIIYNYTSSTAGDELCLEELLWYLHENGVVLKVDRELPENRWQAGTYSHSTPHLCIGHDAVKEAQDNMLEDGFVAVEPLIEEKEPNSIFKKGTIIAMDYP